MTSPGFFHFKRPGVITGLAAEARCFPTPVPCLHGIGPAAARANSRILVGQQHDLLISAGLAGGLAPDLPCGCLIIGTGILSTDHPYIPCDSEAAARLAQHLTAALGEEIPIRHGVILSTPGVIANPQSKRRLHGTTGALAVDMESYGVGQIALEAARPVVVLRVIADIADQIIPPSAQAALSTPSSTRPTGIRIAPLLAALIRHPGEIIALIRLAAQTRRALKTLRRCGAVLAEGLAEGRDQSRLMDREPPV